MPWMYVMPKAQEQYSGDDMDVVNVENAGAIFDDVPMYDMPELQEQYSGYSQDIVNVANTSLIS